jgi:hypothetical protein
VVGTCDLTQGDSGGNVNVLGSDNIGFCEEKRSYSVIICLIVNGTRIELSALTNTRWFKYDRD